MHVLHEGGDGFRECGALDGVLLDGCKPSGRLVESVLMCKLVSRRYGCGNVGRQCCVKPGFSEKN